MGALISMAAIFCIQHTVWNRPSLYRSPGPMQGPQLVDGGIRANLPIGIADELGVPLIFAVKLLSYLEKAPRKDFDTYFEYADRVTSIFMTEIEQKAIGGADILIEPKVDFMTMHSFDREHVNSVYVFLLPCQRSNARLALFR